MQEGAEGLMGEVADDFLDGSCCSWCSAYFQTDHGYQVLCSDCWKTAKPEERKDFQRAVIPETNT